MLFVGSIVSQKSLLIPLSIFFIVLLQFQIPGKYYSFELIPPGNYSYEQEGFEAGISEGYGIIMSDFIAIWILLYFLKKTVSMLSSRASFIIISHYKLNSSLFFLTMVSWGLAFFLALLGSLYFSFFPSFSVIVLLQHMKILVAFWLIYYLLYNHQSIGKKIIKETIFAVLVFQIILGISQISAQLLSFNLNSGFRPTYIVPDESVFSLRPYGSFAYANQYAFILSMILFIYSVTFVQDHEKSFSVENTKRTNQEAKVFLKNKKARLLTIIPCLAMMILTQSRVIWLIILLGGILFYREIIEILKELKSFLTNNSKFFIFFIIIFEVFFILIFPRFLGSATFFSEEGGGYLRYKMIRDGLQILQTAPVLGYGVETSIYQAFQLLPSGYIFEFPFAIHNAFLQLAIEQGILGILLFFFPFLYLFRKTVNLLIEHRNWILKLNHLVLLSFFLYYSLHPSYGRVEFPFLGISLALVIYNLDTFPKKYIKSKHVSIT